MGFGHRLDSMTLKDFSSLSDSVILWLVHATFPYFLRYLEVLSCSWNAWRGTYGQGESLLLMPWLTNRTLLFFVLRGTNQVKQAQVWFKASHSPSERKTMPQCDFRPITNSSFGHRITAARWKLLKVMQMWRIRILSRCHYMCLLRCTFSAMFKLNKTLNDCVVWHLINMFLFTSVPLVLKK